MANLPHLVQYQGSKRKLAAHIIRFLPGKVNRLVEPFAGTGAISIATAAKQMSRNFWLNDLNKPLIDLFKMAVEDPNQIVEAYKNIWNQQHSDSIAHYFEVRARFNKTSDPKLFLYLLARCVKGSVRYNSDGLFNQSLDKRRKGTQPKTMSKNIEGVSSLLKGRCLFTCIDYREVLAHVQDDDFIYIDPPYQGVCGHKDSRYLSGINFDEFVIAIEKLNKRKIKFAISYDGKLGNKTFGKLLPESLELKRIEIAAGRSSQSTLLGRKETTVESLYLSPNLVSEKLMELINYSRNRPKQINLWEKHDQRSKATR